jgi:hypothetical protein
MHWLPFFSLEFPENRENNREFAIFLTGLAIFDVKSSINFDALPKNSLQIRTGNVSLPEQGIDPPEQGITGILLL